MAGLLNPEAASKLAARIKKLYDGALELGTKETEKQSSKIGRVFQDLTKRDPGYFITRPDFIDSDNADDLIRKINERYGFLGTEHEIAPLGRLGLRIESGTGAIAGRSGSLRDAVLDGGSDGGHADGIIRALRGTGKWGKMRAGMSPESEAWVADTMATNPGQGANQFYRGFYDKILHDPDSVNISNGLSSANSFRRTVNMVPVYERYGEPANRIVIDSDQLVPLTSGRQNYGKIHAFHSMPTDAQIGLLNSIIAQRAAHEVDKMGAGLLDKARLSERGSMLKQIGDDGLRAMKELRLDPESPWVPSTDVEEWQLRGLADLLRQNSTRITGGASPIGYDSLRRAAIAADADAGLEAGDLATQPWLTRGLGRRTGGRIPHPPQEETSPRTSPLSQLFR